MSEDANKVKRGGRRNNAFTRERHEVICSCGQVFVTAGTRTTHCPSCRRAWDRFWNRAAYKAKREGLTREEMHAAVEREYRAWLADPKRRADMASEVHRCPFCGTSHTAKSAYCALCRHQGYDEVHKTTGKTNGWKQKERSPSRVVGGWRGRPCAGGGAACSVAKLTASLAVDYVRCK